MEQTFRLPILETIRTAWEEIKGTKAPFWGALFLLILIMFCLGIAQRVTSDVSDTLSDILQVVIQVVNFLLQMGMLMMGIKRAFDSPVTYRVMFEPFTFGIAVRAIVLYILELLIFIPIVAIFLIPAMIVESGWVASAIIAVGVCIVIYLATRIIFAKAFVLDKLSSPWQAIKLSFVITRQNFWRIFILGILESLIVLVSLIPIIGIIWTLPFAYILYGVAYRSLLVNMRA